MTKKKTVADLLRAARERISNPDHWTKNTNARDANGTTCSVFSHAACSFCAMGTVFKETRNNRNLEGDCFTALSVVGNSLGIATFNDAKTTKHKDVLAMFDKAIEFAEKKYAL